MAENTNDTGAETFFTDINFGEISDDEYNTFLETNPDLRDMLEEEKKGLFTGEVSLAQIMGIPDEELLGAASAGTDFLKEKRWDEARDIFAGLTTLEPAAPMFHMGLAQAFDGLGETDSAIESFTSAIDLSDEGTEEDGAPRLARESVHVKTCTGIGPGTALVGSRDPSPGHGLRTRCAAGVLHSN